MAKRRFDFDNAADDTPPTPAPPPAPPPAAATPAPVPAPASTPAAAAPPPATRQPGLRRKPVLVAKPAVLAVVEGHDHRPLATLYLTGRVEDDDNVPVMQFRANGDIEDSAQRVLGRFIELEIRDHANRPMAVFRDGALLRPSGAPIGYLQAGRIDNEARGAIGYYQVLQTPAGGRPVEALVAAYLLWFQPNIWQDDQA